MEKKFSLLLALICAVGTTFAAGSWMPSEHYATFCDNFKFDHAFRFYNEGGKDNGSKYSSGVDFQECQGVIAFSLMSWDRYDAVGENYGLTWVEVYLTASGQNDMYLADIHFTDPKRAGSWENTYNNESNFSAVYNKNGCTTYFLQKRQYKEHDRCQFSYFNIAYSKEVYDYIHSNRGTLGLRLRAHWNHNTHDKRHTFSDSEKNDIMERLSDPVLENFQWTKGSDGSTALRFTASGIYNSIYHERAAGGAVSSAETMLPSSGALLSRERSDVNSLARDQLNLMGKDNPPYAIEVARQTNTYLTTSYYNGSHGGPKSPYASPQSDWKKIWVPALYLPENINLSHPGGDTIYATFDIPRKSYGREEDESAIIIEYSTDENLGSYEAVRVDYNTYNRNSTTSYRIGLPIPQQMLNKGRQVVYVRFSREFVDHSTTCVKESILINGDLRKVSAVEAQDIGGKIQVSWSHDGDFKGIWTSDMVYRVKYTVNSTTYSQDYPDRNLTSVVLTEGIPTCVPIVYTVQICTDTRTLCSASSEPITLASTREAVITSLTATKGDSNNRVRLQWTVPKDKNDFSYFTITRSLRGDSATTTLVPQMMMNHARTTFTYEDNSMELGTYYNYTVTGYRECNGSVSPMSSLTETGFAIPYGVVTGQITYDGRQGVPGVLVTATTEEEVPMPEKLVTDTVMTVVTHNFRTLKPSTKHFIQGPEITNDHGAAMFWIRVSANDRIGKCILFELGNKFYISLEASGFIRVIGGGSSSDDMSSEILTLNAWYHLAVSYSSDYYTLYLNGNEVARKRFTPFGNRYSNKYNIGDYGSKSYEMADVRLYNYSMDSTDIHNTALTIPLKGNESGLELYYSACEEGNEVHDLSGHGRDLNARGMSFGNYTSTDSIPKVEFRTVKDSTRMSYTAYTKSDGTYVITGIPYREAGTYYKIVPTLGTHEFAPANRPLYFNNNTNTHNNVNFTDRTSVRVSGTIYYEGTDYPVEGVALSVDGTPCIVGGVPVLTNKDGQFSVLVPMGQHYITATKNGHTFAYDGRYPEDPNNAGVTHEFLHDITDLRFYDNTKLLLVGRVAGGDEEMHKPHGMHLGKATIGRAVITLEASSIYSLNTDSVERVWAQPTDSIIPAGKVVTSASGTDLSHNVVIYTDSLTGEFTALLPPLTYKVKSIDIPSNDEYRYNPLSFNPIELGARAGQMMLQDTLRIDSTTVRRVRYHLAFDAPYYVEPILTVTDAMRSDLAFGEEWIPWQDEKEKLHMVPSFTIDSATGKPDYRMTYPIFRQGKSYRWRLKVTETYINKDNATHPVTTVLPWKNGIVSVKSELGNRIAAERDTIVTKENDSTSMISVKKGETIALGENQIALDSTGTGIYQFRASDPNITKPYTLGVDMSYTNVYGTRNYSWTENGKFYGVTLGSITNGSDILTSGPDDVLYILRNAPGGASTVAATKGSTFTKNYNNTASAKWGGMANFQFGLGEATVQGVIGPFVSLMFMDEAYNISVNGTYMGNKSWTESQAAVTTLTQTVSTTPGLTGAAGDVFVGQSTNEVFSNSRRVDIQRDPKDSTLYFIGDFDGFVYGKRFGTQFVYTQNHIETKLLPDFQRARNALLQTVDEATIQRYQNGDNTALVNTTDKMKYFTSLSPTDPNFGADSTYVFIAPQPKEGENMHVEKDMVHYYNEQVRTWKKLMEHNEQMKVMCLQRSGAFKQDQYDAAVKKVARLGEVTQALREAREQIAAVNQYNIDSLRAFNKHSQYGDGQQYQGFSKGEVERLIKTYDDNKKKEQEQLSILESENLDTLRQNISDYYGGGYLMRNISLSPGASVVLGDTRALSQGDNVSITHDATLTGGFGVGYKGIVRMAHTNNVNAGGSVNTVEGKEENNSFSTNITLAMNATSSMSFDMYASPDGFAPIFFVRGGATSCPYIDEERTKYFEPGRHVLTTSTAAIDAPKLYLRQGSSSMQHDLPVGASAYFTLGMTNQSSVSSSAGMYKLRPIDKHTGSQLGAVLEVNGTPLTSAGITYALPAGDSTFVSLRIYQSNPEVMRYDSIGLELISDCDPTRRSELWLTVSYRYSCSDINLTLDNTLLNTQTKSILGKDTVELSGEISGLLPNYSALYGIRLQYKRGEGEWSTMRTWRKGITVRDNEGNYPMPEAEHFRFNIPMPDKDYADGIYQVRAVTVCKPAAEEEVCKESETFTVVKDVVRPEPLTTPTPTDGVLRNGNDISVTFTKDIQSARVLATNISVTGELNGHDLRHSVGLQLGGQKAATQATLRLGASDFTIETWLNYSESGELMNIGGDKFRLSLTEEGKLAVQIDTATLTAADALPRNKWVFLALSYVRSAAGNRMNASIAYDEVTKALMTDIAVPNINTKAALQLGSGTAVAAIHDLTVWSVARDMTTSLSERSRAKLPTTPGLVAYWPMDEGYGPVAAEHVHARHIAAGDNAWWIAGENYSAVLDGSNALRVPVSEVDIAAVDDYVLEFWVNANSDGTILRNGDTTIVFAVKDAQLTVAINGVTRKTTPFAPGTWHHIALNVRRSGSTSVILDEHVVYQYVDGNTTPRLGDYLTIGEGLTGAFDELRIARASVTNELLLLSAHFRFHGNETGLVAYYPFEKDSIDSGNQHQTVPTLEDRCTNALNKHSAYWLNGNSQLSNTNHPALVEARPVESVPFTFTASDRQITIQLNDRQMAPARVEGCNLRVEVKNVIDENGNYSAPICWNIYVQRNSLLWEDSYASVTKNELDEQSFELTMVNTGSEMQSWQITNIPAWLQLNATSGVIRPQSELTLTATLPASLAAGYYSDILLLTGNDGIPGPCVIEASVLAPEPDWKVNEAAYEATGNIIARLALPAGVAQSEHDILAAFTDGECVGIAHPQYIDRYDAWYVMMTVYGNTTSKTNMQFRLWNAETGITYSAIKVLPAAFRFTPNMVKGTVADPVVLEVTNRLQQTMALLPSWNWISLNVNPTSANTEKVLEPILGDIQVAKSKTQIFTVNAADTTYGGTLKKMGVTGSYRIYALRPTTLTVDGTTVNCAGTPITIRKGWNWIGYLPLQTMSVADALADIEPATGDLVKSKFAFATYDGAQWVGTLTRMTAGEGYMYLSNTAETFTFTYPETSVVRSRNYIPAMLSATGETVFEPVTDPYSGNMSIVARVLDGKSVVHDVEVGIFAGEECRGTATEEMISDTDTAGYWFLTVAGDEQTPLTIKVYDPVSGKTTIVEQSLQYTDDAILGTLAEPYIIQLGVMEGVEDIQGDNATGSGNGYTKTIEDGILYILRNGDKYEVTGKKVPVAQ